MATPTDANTIRRAQLRKLPAHRWLVLLNLIQDDTVRVHVANLVWWDYLDKPKGQPSSPAFKELMHTRIPDISATHVEQIRAALLTVGYPEKDAVKRSTPSNGTSPKTYGPAFRQGGRHPYTRRRRPAA